MTAKEEVKRELERRLASREKIKEEIEINQYDLEKLFRRLKDGEDVVNLIQSQHFTTFTPPRKLMKLVYTRPELSPLDFLRFGP